MGAVATVTTFEDIDKRYIKPYLAPDTPATPPRSGKDGGKDDDAEAPRGRRESFAIAPPPASPAPARSGGHVADAARAAGGDDDGEMTPVKFDT